MSVDLQLRTLEIDVPVPPDVLLRLHAMLQADDVHLERVSDLVQSDMALAAAVLKTANSSFYGLSGRARHVHEAVSVLGIRDVAAITAAVALRAMFPAASELDSIWERAAVRGLLMARIGQLLQMDAWGAHSAGLFEECGKAVLFKHAPDRYRAMLKEAGDDTRLKAEEHQVFGVTHDALGAALCETWGLSAAAVLAVRHHVDVLANHRLPDGPHPSRMSLAVLSAVVNTLMSGTDGLAKICEDLGPPIGCDPTALLEAAVRVKVKLEARMAGQA